MQGKRLREVGRVSGNINRSLISRSCLLLYILGLGDGFETSSFILKCAQEFGVFCRCEERLYLDLHLGRPRVPPQKGSVSIPRGKECPSNSNYVSAENWVMELWEIWKLLITHVSLLFSLLGYFSFWCFSSSVSNTHIAHH